MSNTGQLCHFHKESRKRSRNLVMRGVPTVRSDLTILMLSIVLYFLSNFSLMLSIHCSNSENSNGGRIDAFTKRSILPLEIWPKRQCHNFDEIASIRLRFLVTFSYEETFLFSEHTTFTFLDNESKYNLSCRKARPTHSE